MYGLDVAHPLGGAPWAAWAQGWVWTSSFACLFAILLLFPTGSVISSRWRGVARAIVLAALLVAPILAVVPGPLSEFPTVNNPLGVEGPAGDLAAWLIPYPLIFPLLPLLLVVSASSVMVRFWRSTGIERQQLKWFGYATAVVVLTFGFTVSGWLGSWGDLISNLGLACLPVGITLAVLRYRLYEIDRIINRTLVYGLLTAVLAVVYWSGVFLLQQVLRPLTQGSDLAIIGSTLAVAALFQPARQRIQGLVDRRFYRHKYDAARTLEAFSSRLREQIELDSLGAELLAVVGQTMQPQLLSLWLRPPAKRRNTH
jgi:hypothetical protein